MVGVSTNKKEDKWVTYKNGNYNVHFNLNDGTKIRENNLDNFTPAFAENMDIKITNYCDGGCAFCYEDCNKNGEHCDFSKFDSSVIILFLSKSADCEHAF